MRIFSRALIGIGLGALVSTVALASSIIPNGDFTFGEVGTISYVPSGGALNTATAITLQSHASPYRGLQIASLPASYLAANNVFCNSFDCPYDGATPLFVGEDVAMVGTTGNTIGVTGTYTLGDFKLQFVDTGNGDVMTFIGDTRTVTTSFNASTQAESLSIYYLGTFSDSLGLYVGSSPASVVFSFSQTGGATGGVSGSGVFATPPEPPIGTTPEPATMAMLGSALLGIGLIRRRKV